MSINEKLTKVKLLWNDIDTQNTNFSYDYIEECDYLIEKILDDTNRLKRIMSKSIIARECTTSEKLIPSNEINKLVPSTEINKLDETLLISGRRLDYSPNNNIDYDQIELLQELNTDEFTNDFTDEDFQNLTVLSDNNVSKNDENKFDSDATDEESNESLPIDIKYLDCLKKYFGYSHFKPLQWKIIDSVLNKQKDNCVIMSTGYGKSLCYQFPSVFTNKCSIIISPLISLMEDQVMSLSAVNIASCLLGPAQNNMALVKKEIFNGKIKIIYMTPEYAISANDILTEILDKIGIDVLAIDEAHCVSQWGNDFRTSYRSLGKLRSILKGVPIMALTATATEEVRKDICKSLKLVNPIVTCSGFDRPNLYLSVNRKSHKSSQDFMIHLIQIEGRKSMFDGPTIIYCPTKKSAEDVETVLRSLNCSCALYHAGLPLPTRKKTHQMFINDEINVIVATVAFGMGIDKPDVRNVIHYGAPKDIESYYQEIGRAGRDGLPSKCIVYYSSADFSTNRYFLTTIKDQTFLNHKKEMLNKMENYLSSNKCRREMILVHFNKKEVSNKKSLPNCCDNCENSLSLGSDNKISQLKDLTEEAKLLFESIMVFGGKFGLTTPIMFMRGSTNQKLNPKYRTHHLFGKGKNRSELWWKTFARQMISEDYLTEKNIIGSFGSTVDLSNKSVTWLNSGAKEFLLELNKELLQFEQENIKPDFPNNYIRQSSMNKTPLIPTNKMTNVMPVIDPIDEKLQVELYSQLIKIRNEISQEIGLYSFNIFSNKILLDLSRFRPTSIEDLCSIDDVAVEKANKYGDKFIDLIKQFSQCNKLTMNILKKNELPTINCSNPNLSETVQATYQLFQLDKLSLDDVAKVRNLKPSTLVNHLCTCISQCLQVDVNRLIDEDSIKYIADVINRPPISNDISRLVPIKEQLPNHTFEQIRIVITLLQTNQLPVIKNESLNLLSSNASASNNKINDNSTNLNIQIISDESKSVKKRKLPEWMISKSSHTDKNIVGKKIKNSQLFE